MSPEETNVRAQETARRRAVAEAFRLAAEWLSAFDDPSFAPAVRALRSAAEEATPP